MNDIIKNVDKIVNLRDDQVTQWYEDVLAKNPTVIANKVDNQASQTRTKHADPEASVQEYMFSRITDLRALGSAHFMNEKPQMKSMTNYLANGLMNTKVKQLLFRETYLWNEGEHFSISSFILVTSRLNFTVKGIF